MVVIIQNRTQTIPFKNMCFSVSLDGCIVATQDIIEKPSELKQRIIAEYDSQERAKEVLLDMCRAYANKLDLYIMPSNTEVDKETPEHDGCKGCKYINLDLREYPCTQCKQNYVDKWETE